MIIKIILFSLILSNLNFLFAENNLKQYLQADNTEEYPYGYLYSDLEISGIKVSIWNKNGRDKKPIIIFSHGFRGCATQSSFLTEYLAENGYIVIAIDHRDSLCSKVKLEGKLQEFRNPASWNDTLYLSRRDDIHHLVDLLKASNISDQIDWNNIGLMGHSLGGYTVLGLAGAWPKWKIAGIKAVLALSPFCAPYVNAGQLESITAPVMYQGGTLDFGISPSIKKANGCFTRTPAPVSYVEFEDAGHLAWADVKKNETSTRENIQHYSNDFFDKYLKSKQTIDFSIKRPGVSKLVIR